MAYTRTKAKLGNLCGEGEQVGSGLTARTPELAEESDTVTIGFLDGHEGHNPSAFIHGCRSVVVASDRAEHLAHSR